MSIPALQTYLLVLGFAAALTFVLANAPKLGPGYRSVDGPRAETPRRMFDEKEYALAHAWSAVRQGDPRAVYWARRGIAAAPDNAYAWLALAWGLAIDGKEPDARAALDRSYRLAPRSMPLAVGRTALGQRWWPELNPNQRRRLLEEVRIARGLDAHAFNMAAVKAPRLALLYRMSR